MFHEMTYEVMQHAALIFWPILSLLIFTVACVILMMWTFRSGSGPLYRQLGSMALEDSDHMPLAKMGKE